MTVLTRRSLMGAVLLAGSVLMTAHTSAQGAVPARPPLSGPGTLDTSFGPGGYALTDFNGQEDIATRVLRQPDGKVIAVGAATPLGAVYGNRDVALARYNPDGSLDTTFSGGRVETALPTTAWASGAALMPDGRIVVGALQDVNGNLEITLLRYMPPGWLDSSFGYVGMATFPVGPTAFTPGPGDTPVRLALQPDGSVIAVTTLYPLPNETPTMVVLRVTPSGTLDPTFGSGGMVTTTEDGQANSLALQPDGKVLIAVGDRVLRLNSNGSTDASFGTAGYASEGFSNTTTSLAEVTVEKDGHILATGITPSFNLDPFVVRWLPNGHLDPLYGANGIARIHVSLPPSENPMFLVAGMVEEADRSVVIAGSLEIQVSGKTSDFIFVVHVLATAQIDVSFGSNGMASIPVSGFGPEQAILLDPDGFVYLGGSNAPTFASDFLVAKMRLAAAPPGPGYWLAAADGGIFTFGTAPYLGSMGGIRLNKPIVGVAATRTGHGYWMVAPDGGVFAFGDATFYGSTGNLPLNQPIVGIAPTPTGHGYWLVAADGGIFSFGDARFAGSMAGVHINQPVVGIAADPTGHGYWMVGADGAVYSFGGAPALGSAGNLRLNHPIVAMSSTPTGLGYWLVASDGGVFSFGDAAFYGSTGNLRLNQPIIGMSSTPTGNGYWLTATDGGIFSFGDATFYGSTGNIRLNQPIVGIAAQP